jgi:TPR repeat protein
MNRHRMALAAVLLGTQTLGTLAAADTLDLAFMPPAVVPQDLCIPGSMPDEVDNLDLAMGEDNLTDELRLRYIQRDIRNLQAKDADRWFDFILTLIDWQARLDPGFDGTGAALARIALYIDAGRLDDLRDQNLIDQLRAENRIFTNAQRMALAEYYLNGIGVATDPAFARTLIREAAYGGNPQALLTIARLALQGTPVEGWDAPLDMTVTLAFGGMLGQMNSEVCRHAERIAQQYLAGDVVTRNPEIAQAWFRFAADLGGADAAWRIVEYHLEADAAHKDNAEMLKYLRLAVARGITVDAVQAERIRSAGNLDEATLSDILGFNFSADTGRTRPSLSGYFQLGVNLDAEFADPDSTYLDYLYEVIQFDTAPGFVFTELAKEVLIRKGRWAGEVEAMEFLEQAAARKDAEGMQLLARMLMRYRDNPAQVNRAVDLLTEAVTRFGRMSAMNDLDGLFRCQAVDAPLLNEADYWATAYQATQSETVAVSPADLLTLDPFKDPETIAQIQTQALQGDPQSLANFLERVQVDPLVRDSAHRLWATRADGSDKALENFAELETDLATNPAERDLAIELFRRIYLNNGVTTALDVSVALLEDNGRNPDIAAEIVRYLTEAGNRGEGAAIRLLARLTAETTPESSVYRQFADIIEDRGDFLALMFAMPYLTPDKAQDYIDRAVSLMTCGTKDVEELGDAATLQNDGEQTFHWERVGLAIPGGNVLSKLAISDRQMAFYDVGAAPDARRVLERALAEGDQLAHRTLYDLTADPDLPTFDPPAAADHLIATLSLPDQEGFVLDSYRTADPEVRSAIAQRLDMAELFLKVAQAGDIAAKRDYALMLRDTATTLADLQDSARWLQEAADGGDVVAMTELGRVLAYGIGIPMDRPTALVWLDQAARAGSAEAATLARLLELEVVR